MMEIKDQGIKLFGKKIALPEEVNFPVFSGDDAGSLSHGDSSGNLDLMEMNDSCLAEKKVSGGQKEEDTKKDDAAEEHSGTGNSKTSSESDENPKTPSIGEESATVKSPNDQTDTTTTLKKPDKILPCPRCNSMDTKFCYYNNYNVNQPRHFCKSCQRYWTAGGTMRNVPVGAGRRKTKNSASICSHVTISDPPPNGPTTETNGTVLSFSSDRHLNGTQNGNNCSGGVPYIPWPCHWNPSNPVPVPFYPAPYWSYNFNPYSSNLGKHSREGELIKQSNIERKIPGSSILVPKTLRIDDLDEAAKSSIWETLGIKNDCINRGGLFKAFERKGDEKNQLKTATSPVLQANPAAMSRSLNFQERA